MPSTAGAGGGGELGNAERLSRSFGADDGDADGPNVYNVEKRMSDFSAARASDAIAKLQDDPTGDATRKEVHGSIVAMLDDMHQIASNCNGLIQTAQSAATHRLRRRCGRWADYYWRRWPVRC